MKFNVTADRAMFALIVILLAVAGDLAFSQQSLNQGIGLPTNGPCTPFTNEAGLCSDGGIPAVYGVDGVIVHLPVAGKDGINGVDGKNGTNGTNGRDGIDGKNGVDGKDGLPGKDAVFPQTVILSCPPASGTVAKGFTAKCTLSLPQ